MDHGVVVHRIRLGHTLRVVGEDKDGVEVAGAVRLRPGQRVRVDRGNGLALREAIVWTWQVTRMGSDGTDYRGYCRWT